MAVLIDRSVALAVEGEGKVGVAFSGGLDSSIIAACASRHATVVAFTAFVDGAFDSKKAAGAASALGIDIDTVTLTEGRVAEAGKGMALPYEASLMDRSLWCLYSIVARKAKEEGANALLLGQLADELFGGYAKYADVLDRLGAQAASEAMARDVAEYPSRGRVRDELACGRWVQARFPFCSEEVVAFAVGLPMEYKIRGGVRKAVLRRAAEILGLPEEVLNAEKKAAQYSSGIQRLVH